MREPFEKSSTIFNLFTSFYFENDEDNLTTLKSIKAYLNMVWLSIYECCPSARDISSRETKTVEGMIFHIKRYLKTVIFIKKLILKTKDKISFTEK
jgi:hypothetical protein